MGLGSSRFSLLPANKITSKEDYKLKTQEMTTMADALFTFMFKSSKENIGLEAFNIAAEPDKYVVALSELINKQFAVLGYTTTRTAQGEIYFAKYDKLNPASLPLKEKEEHKRNCKLVAFFFVRIYQILGSMLMIIKDSSLEENFKENTDPYLERAYIGSRISQVNYTQRGGAIDQNIFLGPLEFLRSSLVNPSEEDLKDIGPLARIPEGSKLYKIEDTDLLVINKDYKSGVTMDDINKTPPTFIIVTINPTNRSVTAYPYDILITNMNYRTLSDNKSLNNITFRTRIKGLTSREYTPDKNKPREITIEKRMSENGRVKYTLYTKSGISEDVRLARIQAASYYKHIKFSETVNIKYWLNFYFLSYATRESSDAILTKTPAENLRDDDDDHPGKDVSSDSSLTSKSGIKNEVIKGVYTELLKGSKEYDTISADSRITPASGKHCVKRAIQLLNAESIFKAEGSNEKSYTRICKFSAPDRKESEVPFDVFTPTKTFAQLYGKIRVNPDEFEKTQEVLKALIHTLGSDHTTVTSATNNVLNLEQIKKSEEGRAVQTETNDLNDALLRLQEAFKLLNDPASKEAPKGFNDIKMKIPNECATIKKTAADSGDLIKDETRGSKTDGGIVVKNDNMIRQLRNISQELLAYHVNSTIEITKFLETIFNITKDSSGNWRVSGIKESLMIAGFPALDNVTDIARDLILKYYEGCEKKYQKGVKLWLDENKNAPAAVPAPPKDAAVAGASAGADAAAAAAAPLASPAAGPAI